MEVCLMLVPFGKHAGLALCEVPDEDLRWLLTVQVDNRFREEVLREFYWRRENDPAREARIAAEAEALRRRLNASSRAAA